MKLNFGMALVLTLALAESVQVLAASFTVHAVQSLDANPYGLTITNNTTNVSLTPGGTSLTLAQFQTLMQGNNGAFASDNGGVLDAQQIWQGGSWPANAAGNNNGAIAADTSGHPLTVTYGATQANTLQLWRDTGAVLDSIGIDSNVSNGTNVVSGGGQNPSGGGGGTFNFATGIFNDSTDTSAGGVGGGYIGIQGAMPVGLVFNNGVAPVTSPVSNLTAFAITQVPRGSARSFDVVATFSDSTTFDTGIISYTTTGANFVGIQAPAGQTITRIDLLDPNSTGLTRFDDMAFVTNAPADTGGWKLTNGASWSSTGSWATGIIPNVAGASASFRGALTTSGNVALDGSKTVGQVVFVNSSASYTITQGSGGSLTIDNTGGAGTAAISVSGGNHTIAAPVILANASTQLYTDLGTSLTITNNISDTGSSSGITKVGAGTVLFSGNNTYGGTTTVNLGTLDVSKPGALPGYNTAGRVTVNAGGTLAVSVGGVGQFAAADVDALLTNVTFAVQQAITPARLGFDTTSGSFNYAASMISGTAGIDKIGPNTLVLGDNNTNSGPTRILGGTVSVSSLNSFPNTLPSSGLGNPANAFSAVVPVGTGSTGATLLYTGAGETTNRIIDMAGTTGGATIDQSGTGALVFGGGFTGANTLATSRASVTASGAGNKTLTLQGSTSGTGEIQGVIIDHQTIATAFSPAAITSVLKQGSGSWKLSGVNTYTGSTTVNQGTLALGTNDAIDKTSQVTLAGGTLNTGGQTQTMTAATLQLNGNSTIDFSDSFGGSDSVTFANSSATSWTGGKVLRISNWNGATPDPTVGGGIDQLLIAGDNATLTGLTNSPSGGQLAQIHFTGYLTGARLVAANNGTDSEVVPAVATLLTLGDINQDAHVNVKDISALTSALSDLPDYQAGTKVRNANNTTPWDVPDLLDIADINGDGQVNNADVQALINLVANTNNGAGTLTAVPEPTSFILLACGILTLAACRRSPLKSTRQTIDIVRRT